MEGVKFRKYTPCVPVPVGSGSDPIGAGEVDEPVMSTPSFSPILSFPTFLFFFHGSTFPACAGSGSVLVGRAQLRGGAGGGGAGGLHPLHRALERSH